MWEADASTPRRATHTAGLAPPAQPTPPPAQSPHAQWTVVRQYLTDADALFLTQLHAQSIITSTPYPDPPRSLLHPWSCSTSATTPSAATRVGTRTPRLEMISRSSWSALV